MTYLTRLIIDSRAMYLFRIVIKQVVVLCLIISPLLATHIVMATSMYKWVDKDGNTQYTQKPPPADVEYSSIKPPPKVDSENSQKALEQRKNKVNELREERHKTAADKKAVEEDLARLKKNCETAKANLASYARPRVTIKKEDGTIARATEEERQRRITEAKNRIAEFCK